MSLRWSSSPRTIRGTYILDSYVEGAAARAHVATIRDLSISPSAPRRLATVGEDGTVRLWPLDAGDLIAHVCARLPRNLTEDEWSRLNPDGAPRPRTCPQLP